MLTFEEYHNEALLTCEEKVAIFISLCEDEDLLNESPQDMVELLEGKLSKLGLHLHRGRGLIDYIKMMGKGIGQLLVAAAKRDTKKMKEILSRVERGDVIDFLLKLDMATLHLVTGPIHTIDAITGWHLWADIQNHAEKAKNIVQDVINTIHELKNKIKKAFDPNKQKKIIPVVDSLEASIA